VDWEGYRALCSLDCAFDGSCQELWGLRGMDCVFLFKKKSRVVSLAGMESESVLRIIVPTLPLLRKGITRSRRRIDSTSTSALRASFQKDNFSEVPYSILDSLWLLRHLSLGGQNFVCCR
jgi:hypothetical protein